MPLLRVRRVRRLFIGTRRIEGGRGVCEGEDSCDSYGLAAVEKARRTGKGDNEENTVKGDADRPPNTGRIPTSYHYLQYDKPDSQIDDRC